MALSIFGALLMVSVLGSGPESDFPVPRAQDEFRLLGPHVRGYCGTIAGDVEAFRRAVFPFGPMDLMVSNGTQEEARILRNLYLGMVSAICKVDALAFSKSFHCGSVCTSERRAELIRKLSSLKKVVNEFETMRGVDTVSQWGIVGEYRINNVYVMMGQIVETKPSVLMGFVPSDHWVRLSDVVVYLRRLGLPETRVLPFLRKVKELALTAVIREKTDVRVVLVGIGNRESGLLFSRAGRAPKLGDSSGDGRRYVTVEVLERGITFYETD